MTAPLDYLTNYLAVARDPELSKLSAMAPPAPYVHLTIALALALQSQGHRTTILTNQFVTDRTVFPRSYQTTFQLLSQIRFPPGQPTVGTEHVTAG